MFQARDYSIFLPSPNAARAFRKLRRLDLLIYALLTLLAILCIWNTASLVQLRTVGNQDLADVSDIADDLSTRLIWIITPITLALVILRVFISGERSFYLMYPLGALLTIALVPAVMTEIQPPVYEKTLRVILHECPPKAVANDELVSIGRCDPLPIDDDTVLLATSDPTEGSFETYPPGAVGQNSISFYLEGRGSYTVYLMFEYDDMETCTATTIFPRAGQYSSDNYDCIRYNHMVWKVIPREIVLNQSAGMELLTVYVP